MTFIQYLQRNNHDFTYLLQGCFTVTGIVTEILYVPVKQPNPEVKCTLNITHIHVFKTGCIIRYFQPVRVIHLRWLEIFYNSSSKMIVNNFSSTSLVNILPVNLI